MNLRISCVLMIDYESLLISGDNEIDILLTVLQKNEKVEEKSFAII